MKCTCHSFMRILLFVTLHPVPLNFLPVLTQCLLSWAGYDIKDDKKLCFYSKNGKKRIAWNLRLLEVLCIRISLHYFSWTRPIAKWLELWARLTANILKLQWLHHPPTQWNLKGGRWSSVEESTLKTKKNHRLHYFFICVKVKKASYDQEVETARANAELAFKLQVYTANEGPVRIQYKCLVPIYVFPEMKLRSLVISKTEL